jgi:cytoskeletal protein RodZ
VLILAKLWERHRVLVITVLAVLFAFLFGVIEGASLEGERSLKVPAEVKTEVHTHVAETEHKTEDKEKERAEVKRVIVYRDRVIKPDGTRIEHEVEQTATDTTTHETVKAESTREVVREVVKRVEIKPAQAKWHAGALVGLDARNVTLLPPSPGPIVFGAEVQHRIADWPLFVGGWGLSNGSFGVGLSFEFTTP